MQEKNAWAYFLTFRTYATFLHGDERLSVDRFHNNPGFPKISSDIQLKKTMQDSCKEEAFVLNAPQRETTLQSFIKTCDYFSWNLFAAHVRTNHAHIILQSNIVKEKTMLKLKAYATQALKKDHADDLLPII